MKQLFRQSLPQGRRYRVGVIVILALALTVIAGSVTAATIADDETYHLAKGVVVEDDLIVFAEDIIIDGTVEGDLIAFGRSIIINGTVTEDVIAAGAEVVINGIVKDDVRAAGASVQIEGRIGDDLFAVGGAGIPGQGPLPINMGGHTIMGGLGTGQAASIGGNGYFAGGFVQLEGLFHNDLSVDAAMVYFDAEVQGDVNLQVNDISFGSNAYVEGDLDYTASRETGEAQAGGVITQTVPEETQSTIPGDETNPIRGFGWWLMRTLLIIIGMSLLGALILTFSKQTLTRPAYALGKKTLVAGLYGLLIAFALVPLCGALVFLAGLFFGWFWGGVASFMFLFGFLILAWALSPMVTGLWLGRLVFSWINVRQGDRWALAVGAAIIVLTARIIGQVPCAGFLAAMLLYLLSFSFAAGAAFLSRGVDEDAMEAPASLLPELEPQPVEPAQVTDSSTTDSSATDAPEE